MIDDVDRTLERLLRERVPLPPAQVEVTFDLPSEAWQQRELTGSRLRVNMYLYDVRENHDLRSPVFREEVEPDGRIVRRRPPARIDLFYCVTAWSPAQPPEVSREHRLLGDVLRTLLRYPTVPQEALEGTLVDQEPPLPTLVAQPDGGLPHPPAEFWSAIGNRLRPALNFVVTVAVQPAAHLEVPKRLAPTTGIALGLGVGVGPVDRLTVRPELPAAHDASEPVRAAEVASDPIARLGAVVRASARTLRLTEGRDLVANEWVLVDDGASSEAVWVAAAPGPGRVELPVEPPLRFPHAQNVGIRRLALGVAAVTTLTERAEAGALAVRVANGNGLAANARLLIGDDARAELVQLSAAGTPGPTELMLRQPLRFARDTGAALRSATPGTVVTRLSEAANQPGDTLTLSQRGPLTRGDVQEGDVLMVGAGADAEFVRVGTVPPSPGRTVPVSPPLRGNHDANAPLRVATEGPLAGRLATAAPAGATEIAVAGGDPDVLRPGRIVAVGEDETASHHAVTAARREPGAVASPLEGPSHLAGDVVDDADPSRPVASAEVLLEESTVRTTTDEHGRFVFRDVADGAYHLSVTATGYAPARKAVQVPAREPDEYRVQLSPG